MSKLEFFKNAIDTLRQMERSDLPAEALQNFDRFVREQIFGKFKIELTAEERDALQDYYIATL